MLVVAGPPGSGKSTLYPVTSLGIDAFNIDDRCAQLVGSYRAIPRRVRDAVAAECRSFIEMHIRERRSFAVETTLRTDAALKQAAAARAVGFLTEMRFVGTDSAEVNIERIKQRAQSGGHAASESEIRSTYDASIENLRAARIRAMHRGRRERPLGHRRGDSRRLTTEL
jgi:predicted ABC-type ATPase